MLKSVVIKYKKKKDDLILTLPEAQCVLLETVYLFQQFCDDIGIKMSLSYGSLLGAVRERNIIKWDNDVDVMMTFEDFNMLKQKLCLMDKYGLSYYHYSSHKNTYTNEIRVYVKGYYRVIDGNFSKYVIPLCIDVFPMCKISSLEDIALKKKQNKKLLKITRFKRILFFKENKYISRNKIVGCFKQITQFFMKLLPANYFHRKIDSILPSLYVGGNDYFLFSPYAGKHMLYFYKKNIFDEMQLCRFGSKEVACIKDSTYYLKLTYGDWMKPVNENGIKIDTLVFLHRKEGATCD